MLKGNGYAKLFPFFYHEVAMIRTNAINVGFFGLWGWRQNYNGTEFTIDNNLTTSKIGRYYQSVHPLLTLKNIKAFAPDLALLNYQNWDSATSYVAGDKVNYLQKNIDLDGLSLDVETINADYSHTDNAVKFTGNQYLKIDDKRINTLRGFTILMRVKVDSYASGGILMSSSITEDPATDGLLVKATIEDGSKRLAVQGLNSSYVVTTAIADNVADNWMNVSVRLNSSGDVSFRINDLNYSNDPSFSSSIGRVNNSRALVIGNLYNNGAYDKPANSSFKLLGLYEKRLTDEECDTWFEMVSPDSNSRIMHVDFTATDQSVITYRASQDNTNERPGIGSSWVQNESFSGWLEDKTREYIIEAINEFWTVNGAQATRANILDTRILFDQTNDFDLESNQDNLVGLQIEPLKSLGVTTKIHRIGLQFTGAEDLTVYVFHSSQKTRVYQQTFTRTKDSAVEWFEVNWELPYFDSSRGAGGSWFIAYDQTGLTEQAINQAVGYTESRYAELAKLHTKYFKVKPFKVNTFTSGEMFDLPKMSSTYSTNFGLNLQFSVECDPTDLIVQQKESFQDLIGYKVAIKFLEHMAFNPEFKVMRQTQNIATQEILFALDGDPDNHKKSGLRHKYSKAIQAATLDLSNMARACFRKKKKGVSYKKIGV